MPLDNRLIQISDYDYIYLLNINFVHVRIIPEQGAKLVFELQSGYAVESRLFTTQSDVNQALRDWLGVVPSKRAE